MTQKSVVIALLLIVAAQAQAATVTIKDSHFTYGGISYFRCNAEEVKLGSYGQKKSPVLKCNYLEVENTITSSHLPTYVTKTGPYAITWENYNKTDVACSDCSLKYFGISASVAISGSYDSFKSADVQLIKFSISNGNMETLLNNYASTARSSLKSEGSDGRVVQQIWVAMSADLAAQFSSATSLSLKTDNGDLDITANHSSGKSYTISLAPGTTFAYLMAKVSDWNSGKTKINDLEDDQWSTN